MPCHKLTFSLYITVVVDYSRYFLRALDRNDHEIQLEEVGRKGLEQWGKLLQGPTLEAMLDCSAALPSWAVR